MESILGSVLVFPSFAVSWVAFVLFNVIYVCFNRYCAESLWCFYKYLQATTRGEEDMMLCCKIESLSFNDSSIDICFDMLLYFLWPKYPPISWSYLILDNADEFYFGLYFIGKLKYYVYSGLFRFSIFWRYIYWLFFS